MKRTLATIFAAGFALVGSAAHAATVIDFEGPTSFESIANFYAGGTDTAGASGPNLGVSFGLDALGLKNDDLGPYFSNAPSPVGVMTAVGTSAAMNVPVGFDGTVSFSYSASAAASVQLWSGLDGTGSLLGTIALIDTANTTPYSNWAAASTTVSGIAKSITFAGAANVAVFDNVTINPVPEPSAMLLMTLGLVGVGATIARRKHKAS